MLAMELLCTILTGVFLWLLIVSHVTSARERVRQEAGPLLLGVKYPRKTVVKSVVAGILTGLLWGLVICFICFLRMSISGFTYSVNGSVFYNVVLQTYILLIFISAFFFVVRCYSLEIRELGLFFPQKAFSGKSFGRQAKYFIPWGDIKYCRWNPSEEKLRISDGNNVIERMVAAKHGAALTKLLGQFVRVLDPTGDVLAAPSQEESNVASLYNRPKKRATFRFRFQFDLRTLLLLTLVVASGFSWYGIRYRRSIEIEQEISKLKEKYGSLIYSHNGTDVTVLDFSTCRKKPTDDDLADLKQFSQLQTLRLINIPISDAGLVHLRSLKQLQALLLLGTGNRITDAGLANIESLTQMTQLYLDGTGITDAGLEHIKRLKNLKIISLIGTQVTPEGFAELYKAFPKAVIPTVQSPLPPQVVPPMHPSSAK
jgi:hypothetical protein